MHFERSWRVFRSFLSLFSPWILIVLGVSVALSEPCTNNDDFYFNVQPKGITVREGGRGFLECNVSNLCNIAFHWVLDGVPVANTTRRFQNGSNLIITRTNRTLDAGKFHCIATLANAPGGMSRTSQDATLTILWIGDGNASVVVQNASSGTDASNSDNDVGRSPTKELVLRCVIDGSGSAEQMAYQWYRNGRIVQHRKAKGAKKMLLRLLNVTAADNGVYSCGAENRAGAANSTSNFVLRIPDPKLPHIRVEPQQEIIASVGTRAVFDCQFDRATRVEWRRVDHAGEPFGSAPGSRIVKLPNDSLVIDPVTELDEDVYECAGYGTDEAPQVYAGRLRLAYLSEFTTEPFEPPADANRYVVGLGKSFEIACVAPPAMPLARLHWRRNGEAVSLSANARVRANAELVLTIEQVGKNDAGEFECVAENVAGRRRSKIEVVTSRVPTIKYQPSSVEVDESEKTELRCEFDGNRAPLTQVVWEKDGRPLPAASVRIRANQSDENQAVLKIEDVRVGDRGRYVCVVRTAGQEPVRSVAATVVVREKLKFNPEPTPRKLEFGSDARIPCGATGAIPAKVSWMKTGRMILSNMTMVQFERPQEGFAANIRDRNGTLFMHKVQFEDAGLYTCVAASTQNVIRVQIPVEVAIFPVFVREPQNTTVVEGETVFMHCEARGTPTPAIQWDREGIPQSKWTEPARFKVFPNNTLRIENVNVRDAGRIACMAGNRVKIIRKDAALCVRVRDDSICYCGQELGGFTAGCSGTESPFPRVSTDSSPTGASAIPLHTIGIACGAAAGYIVLVICLLLYCRHRRRRSMAKSAAAGFTDGHNSATANGSSKPGSATGAANGHLLAEYRSTTTAGGGGGRTATSVADSTNGTLSRRSDRSSAAASVLAQFAFKRENLVQKQGKLGVGVFGDVSLFNVRRAGVPPTAELTRVVVKSLNYPSAQADFEAEVEMFARLKHPNVVRLLGVSSEKAPWLSVFEYLDAGPLKQFLLSSQHYFEDRRNAPPLNEAERLYIAFQVAQGMDHLATNRCTHRDLAARNVLISEQYHAKVTCLSLQTEPFANEYYTYRHLVLPLRWMPPEAFLDQQYSPASDVWSFGVFVWELWTVGELPYLELSNEELIRRLTAGDVKLCIPPGGGEVLAAVRQMVARAMAIAPDDRPSFAAVVELIGRLRAETPL